MKPRTARYLLLLLLVTSPPIVAQVSAKGKMESVPTFTTRSTIDISPSDVPNSFEELLSLSSLVVAGRVDSSSFPARLTNPVDSNSVVESDVVFLVTNVIKGHALDSQKTFKRVVIQQFGGLYKGTLHVPSGESLLEQGQDHILFLQPELRTGLPNIAGLPRYRVVGVWSGKFRVEKIGGLHASPKAAPGLRAHDSKTVSAFVAEMLTVIAQHPELAQ